MNLSGVCKVNVGPTGGDTLTVTCFACGMPSSKEWAQRVRSRMGGGYEEPFYPLLADMAPPPCGAVVMDDGSVYLCAFCHALLEAQWNNYETKPDSLPPAARKYNVHKFICAVCAVETYRKRVRALPFQEFPFLVKQRQSGSITLGNNPLAVVCLDCSETLWAQSAEYDRWGLPIHKRHFNWMARPPPPEDSVEATVARLPSGETQLPRCPPTDPLVPPKTNEPMALPEAIPPVKSNKYKTSGANKQDSFVHSSSTGHSSVVRHHHSQHIPNHPEVTTVRRPVQSGRKNSLGTSSTALDVGLGGPHTQPPVVTVAPMSTQHTLTNSRKDFMSSYQHQDRSLPSSHHSNKYEGVPVTVAHSGPSASSNHGGGTLGGHPGQLYHQTPLFSPSGSYPGPFPWPSSMNREGHPQDIPSHLSFGHFSGSSLSEPLPNPPTWPWSSSPELLRYQSYISSLQNRRLSEAFYGSPAALYPPTSSTSTYLPPLQLHGLRVRTPSPPSHQQVSASSTATTSQNLSSLQPQHAPSFHEIEQSILEGNVRSGEFHNIQQQRGNYSSDTFKPFNKSHNPKSKSLSSNDVFISGGHQGERIQERINSPKRDSSPERFQSKAITPGPSASDQNSSKRKSSMSKSVVEPICYSSTSKGERTKKADVLLPKKRHWQPLASDNQSIPQTNTQDHRKSSLDKRRKFSLNVLPETDTGRTEHFSRPVDFTFRQSPLTPVESLDSSSSVQLSEDSANVIIPENTTCSAIDLTVAVSGLPTGLTRSRTASCPSSSKFSIAFLSKSESVSPSPDDQADSSSRSSVIVSNQNQEEIHTTVSDVKEALCIDSDSHSNVEEANNLLKVDGSSKGQSDECTTEVFESNDRSEMDEDGKVQDEEVINDGEIKDEEVKDVENESEVEIGMVRTGELRIEPEEFVRTTMEKYLDEGKQIEKMRKQKLNQQLDFLGNLGLITLEKKLEIEIESLGSRSDKFTLPPVRMRVKSPKLPKLDEVLEQQLLEVAFNDPSLRNNHTDPEQCVFLKHLGLKPSSKVEKSRREVEWRLVLTERLMREKRDERLRGVKRSWDTYDKVSKLLCLPIKTGRIGLSSECNTSLTGLTLTLPSEIEPTGPRRNSSDLLTTVEANEAHSTFTGPISTPIQSGICINYPKYIPSYVLTAQAKEFENPEGVTGQCAEEVKGLKLLNVPSLNQNCGNESILRIPVVSGSVGMGRRRSSNSTIRTDDSEPYLTEIEDMTPELSCEPLPSSSHNSSNRTELQDPYWTQIDGALTASAAQWLKTKKVMDDVLNERRNWKESQKMLQETALHFRQIRQELKWQQGDMRLTEKLFKAKEKEVLKKLRSLSKYSNPKLTKP